MNNKELRTAQISAGKRIKEIREKLGLSQADLSRKSGVSCSLLCNYEKGKKTVGIDNFVKIAYTLGISLDELYYGDKIITSITQASIGEKIATCIYELYTNNVFHIAADPMDGEEYIDIIHFRPSILKYIKEICAANSMNEEKRDNYLEKIKQTTILEIESENERMNAKRTTVL